jgi:hypothetical protein
MTPTLIFSSSRSFCSAFILGTLTILCLLCGLISFRGVRWLWPDENKTAGYTQVLVFNFLTAAVVSALISFVSQPGVIALLAVLAAGLGIATSYLVLRPSAPPADVVDKRKFRWNYVLALTSLLLLISALPAVGFFKIAHDVQMDLLVKQGQLRLVKALQERATRVENDFRAILGDSTNLATVVQRRLERPLGEATPPSPSDQPLDLYLSAFFETVQDSEPATNRPPASDYFARLLHWLRPLHYRTAGAEGLFRESAIENTWIWLKEPSGPGEKLTLIKPGQPGVRVLRSQTHPLNLHKDLGGVVILMAILLVMYGLARFFARRVFLLWLEPRSIAADDPDAVGQNRLVLISSHREQFKPWVGRQDVQHIDIRNRAELDQWLQLSPGEDMRATREKTVVIDHFEYKFDDPQFNHDKLQLLEKLVADNRRTVIVLSTVDPSNFSFQEAGGPKDDAARAGSEAERLRWTTVFQSFLRDYGKDPETDPASASAPTAAPAFRSDPFRRLRRAARNLWRRAFTGEKPLSARSEARSTRLPEPRPQRNTDQALFRNHTYYRSLWATCSREEQLALYQLARYRFINSRNPELPLLMARGLIVRNPALQVVNNSFRRFVLAAFRSEDLLSNEREQAPSTWNLLKGPLRTSLILVALFLFVTQREMFSASMTIVAGFVTGLPALLKLVSLFEKEKPRTNAGN